MHPARQLSLALAAVSFGCSTPAPTTKTVNELYPDTSPTSPPPMSPDAAPGDATMTGYGSETGACPGVVSTTNLGACFATPAAKATATFDSVAKALTLTCTLPASATPLSIELDQYSGMGEYYNMTFASGSDVGACNVRLDAAPLSPSPGDDVQGSFACPCVQQGKTTNYVTASATFDVKVSK